MADGRARFHEFEVLPGASVVRHRPDGGTYLSQRHISHMLVEAPKVSFEVFGLVASIPPELIRRFRYDLSARVTRSLAVSIKVVQVDNEPLGDDASRFRADDAVATGEADHDPAIDDGYLGQEDRPIWLFKSCVHRFTKAERPFQERDCRSHIVIGQSGQDPRGAFRWVLRHHNALSRKCSALGSWR